MQAQLRQADGTQANIEIAGQPQQVLQHDGRVFLLARTIGSWQSEDVVALYDEAPEDD